MTCNESKEEEEAAAARCHARSARWRQTRGKDVGASGAATRPPPGPPVGATFDAAVHGYLAHKKHPPPLGPR